MRERRNIMSEAYNYRELKVEIIHGKEIVMMSPPFSNHNFVKGNIFGLFRTYLRGKVCVPISDNQKLVLEENDGYVVPDFFVVCDRSKIRKDGVYGAPVLVAEVLSPSTMLYDKGVKKDLYQRAGVKEYWIVEPNLKYIEVYLLQDKVYVLNAIYRMPTDFESDEDKATVVSEFNVYTFPDLIMDLNDIFEYVMD